MFKWMVKKINNKKGFTLIELVVVLALLGILSAIAIPRFTGATADANRRAVEANLRTIDGAIAMYEANKGSKPNSEDALYKGDDATLQSWPEGPDGVTYSISDEGKATATKGGSTGTWWTADDDTVSLPIDWEGSGNGD